MTIINNKEWSDYMGVKAPSDASRITLKVPDVNLDSLRITTTNEDVTLEPVNIGSVTLESNGGNISFEKLNTENVTIQSPCPY